MENLKNYLIKNAEQMLALVILVSVPAITYLVPYKLVFLNFFFIVILFSVYFVEAHKALMGGVLTTLLVVIFVYYFPSSFVPSFTELDLWMNILAWSSFLILTGGAVGKLADRLKMEIKELKGRKRDLETQIDQLEAELAQRSEVSPEAVKVS
ncbi:MAG: bZIP transcription factor [Acidobacteria bacterium]|nr:bZIP transcription factor [Acidobacteriota bacterium]